MPAFHHLLARGLARLVKTEEKNEKLFASPSDSDAWRKQGDLYLSKSLYEQAISCYAKACEPQLQYNSAAFYWFNMARTSKNTKQLYQISAAYFLQAENELPRKEEKTTERIEFIEKAARCLKDGEYHCEAAMLYEAIGKVSIQVVKSF